MLRICGKFHRTQLLGQCLRQSPTPQIPFVNQSYVAIRPIIQPAWRCLHTTSRSGLLKPGRLSNWLVLRRWASSKTADKLTSSSKRSDMVRLLSLAKEEKWFLLASVGCLVVSSAITMGVPFAIGRILDIIFTDTFSQAKLTDFCTVLFGVFLIGGLANFGRVYLLNSATVRIVKNIRSRLYRSMLNQDAGWFDTKGSGELVNRLSTDTTIIGNALGQNLSDGLRASMTIVAGTSMMLYTSPELAMFSLAVVPCITGMALVYGRYVKKITKQLLDKLADVMKIGEERLNNVKTVKLFCKEDAENRLFTSELEKALGLAYKDIFARASFFGLAGLSGNMVIMSVLYYGGTLVSEQTLTVGALTSFVLYAGYTAISLSGLSSFYTELNKGIGAATNLWEIIDRKYAIPIEGGLMPAKKPRGELIFQDVTFSFPTRPTAPILRNCNVRIEPGTVTAIVGRSGSGKSTIGSLLLRFYDPQSGSILLDGTDLKELNPKWLRQNIGAVNQEPVLFSGTIRENVLYGVRDDERDSAELNFDDAVKRAFVDDFVRTLPDGYETLVGQRGMMLSGGQKQRVAIARALIRNPAILILDEATSALDSVSEAFIQKSFENLAEGRTVITIAHRLSTIRNASKIIVVDNAAIAEEGTYAELIARPNGAFRKLIEQQTFATVAGAQ